MQQSIVTLTTDFGDDSPYASAMKGVLLSVNPAVQIVDLTHRIPPQDIWHAAFFLAEAIPFFPPRALHVVVVDPGVGTSRSILYAETGNHRLLVPDNGVLTLLARQQPITRARLVTEPRFWRANVSHTFHGRDIFAPVAGHLSMGLDPTELGPVADEWAQLRMPAVTTEGNVLRGTVLFVDRFGNLLTDLPTNRLPDHTVLLRGRQTASGAIWERPVRVVRTYGEAASGEMVALISSFGWWEFAVVNGHAADALGYRRGDRIEVVLSAQTHR
jgi:S-adenosyl-L-methionine hydrolase (adenosine-forming)